MPTIVRTPGVLSGQPRLEDRRVAVLDVVEMRDLGYGIAEVAAELDVTEAEVRAAADYYDEHRRELERWRGERERLGESSADQPEA